MNDAVMQCMSIENKILPIPPVMQNGIQPHGITSTFQPISFIGFWSRQEVFTVILLQAISLKVFTDSSNSAHFELLLLDSPSLPMTHTFTLLTLIS